MWEAFGVTASVEELDATVEEALPAGLRRSSEVLTHPVFHRYHSEHELLRYLRRLADKDLALDRTMIPLGSCTMKLNAAVEMLPITWPELADVHPFVPDDQAEGYLEMIRQLEGMLLACTGYDAVSLQPNAGSQGELAGLLAIRAYHRSRGDDRRTVCLIPSSAHGTNAASAVMAGLQVVVVACDDAGNVDLDDLRAKVEAAGDRLAAIMVTYPSTHGVFEPGITDLCEIVHAARRAGLRRRRQPQRPGGHGPAGPVRCRREPPEPPQDLLHPPRRWRSRGRPGRGPSPPGAVPPWPPAARRGRPRRTGRRRALRVGRHPGHLVGVHRPDGRRRAPGRDGDGRS